MAKRIFTYLFIASLFGCAFTGTAQQEYAAKTPKVEAHLIHPDSLMIGDQFLLEVEVEKDLTQLVDFPVFIKEPGKPGTIGDHVEVLAEFPIDTLHRDGRQVKIRKRYVLTAFEAGYYNLGVFPALYLDKNIIDTLYSADSLRFFMDTFPIDTATMTIHDIKAPMKTPVLVQEWLGYALLFFLGAQLIAAVWYILYRKFRRKRAGERKPRRPSEPPHITAIRELEKLQAEKLWQNQRHKLYYTRLTDIVREYIEGRYGVYAMEMTSDEIIHAMIQINIPSRSYEQIQRLLSTADYVKFAKYVPDIEDNEMSWNDAYYFVEETKFMAADPAAADGKEEAV